MRVGKKPGRALQIAVKYVKTFVAIEKENKNGLLPQFHPLSLLVGQYAARANCVYGARLARSAAERAVTLRSSRRARAGAAAEILSREMRGE